MPIMNDRELILRYLDHIQQLLGFLVSFRRTFVPERVHGPVMEAWPETLETMGRLKASVRDQSDASLASIGLLGPQLHLKWAAFDAAWQQLVQLIARSQSPELMSAFEQAATAPGSPSDVKPQPVKGIIKKLVEWLLVVLNFVNSFLESLSKVVGFAEIVKEFKECLENMLRAKRAIEVE